MRGVAGPGGGREAVGREEGFNIRSFADKIRQSGLSSFELRELLKPEGYADKVATRSNLTRVQLRKFFAEFKAIYNLYRAKGHLTDEIKLRLYKLYPIIQYQRNRNLIPEDFRYLLVAILDSLDREFEKNIDITMDFIEALVAYAPREASRER